MTFDWEVKREALEAAEDWHAHWRPDRGDGRRTDPPREQDVRNYVRNVAHEHVDPLTGEVNQTGLAEDACTFFYGHGPAPDFDVPERYYELAYEVVTGEKL